MPWLDLFWFGYALKPLEVFSTHTLPFFPGLYNLPGVTEFVGASRSLRLQEIANACCVKLWIQSTNLWLHVSVFKEPISTGQEADNGIIIGARPFSQLQLSVHASR